MGIGDIQLSTYLRHIILASVFIGTPAYAVTLDAVTSGEKGNSGTTLTVSHTVTASGGNRAIYLGCGLRNRTITATATYAGQAMTEVAGVADASTNIRTYLFRKTAPVTGTNDWVATQSSGTAMACIARSLLDVDQATPETDTDNVTCGTGTQTLTLTTAANELLLDVFALALTSSATPGADQTEEADLVTSENTLTVSMSRQDGADGGVMSYAPDAAGVSCYSAASVKHSAFTGSVIRQRGPYVVQ